MANDQSAELVIRPQGDTLVRGESMHVPIVLQLTTPRRVRSVTANFRGAEETKATYITTQVGHKGQVTTQVHTAIEHVDIVQQQWLLEGSERRGCIGNLIDSLATIFGGGRHQRMTPGERVYEVELKLPIDAATTHTGQVSRVFYELTARVDIPLGRDLTVHQSFTVTPPVRDDQRHTAPPQVCYPDDDGRGLWSSLFERDVRMQLSIDRSSAALGDTINGTFLIESPKPLDVRQMHVRLVGHERSEAQGHKDQHHHQGDPSPINPPPVIAPSWTTDFTLPIDVEGPPTATGTRFAVDWFVEVSLDVPWAKDPTIRAPIILVSA